MFRLPYRPRARTAFTLVELLVVIGIIAMLISILMPALQRARDAAKNIRCQSNMRQIGQAFAIYFSTNNVKHYPVQPMWSRPDMAGKNPYGSAYWYHEVMPGTENGKGVGVLVCPSDLYLTNRSYEDAARNFNISYGLNLFLTTKLSWVGNPWNKPCPKTFKNQAKTIVLAESATSSRLYNTKTGNGADSWGWVAPYVDVNQHGVVVARHKAASNILWGDGHVSAVVSPTGGWEGFYSERSLGAIWTTPSAEYWYAWRVKLK